MRLSVYDEPGYRSTAGERWRVLMDGRPLDRVVRVDTCTGAAWVHVTDKDGQPMLDRKRDRIVERGMLGPMRAQRIERMD